MASIAVTIWIPGVVPGVNDSFRTPVRKKAD
jgi:hypothetical protein